MFGTNNNSNQNQINVNTRLYTSTGEDSLMTITGWNERYSIKIHPPMGKNENGYTQYNQNRGSYAIFIIQPNNAFALLKAIDDDIIPAISTGEQKSVSITTENTNQQTGSPEKKVFTITTKNKKVFASIALGVDQNGVANKDMIIGHKFLDREVIKNYNPETGEGERIEIPSDFYYFKDLLYKIVDISGLAAHGIKYSDAIRKNMSDSGSFYKGNNPNSNAFANSSSGGYSAPVTEFKGEDTGDFLPFN